MKWRVFFHDKEREPEVVEAESLYVSPYCGTLMFLSKAKEPAPVIDAQPVKKKPGWPKKAATVAERGFNRDEWKDFIRVKD